VQGIACVYYLFKTLYIVCLINEKVEENIVHVLSPGVFLGKTCSLGELCVCSLVFERQERESLEVARG
jgi:hypothetical protein